MYTVHQKSINVFLSTYVIQYIYHAGRTSHSTYIVRCIGLDHTDTTCGTHTYRTGVMTLGPSTSPLTPTFEYMRAARRLVSLGPCGTFQMSNHVCSVWARQMYSKNHTLFPWCIGKVLCTVARGLPALQVHEYYRDHIKGMCSVRSVFSHRQITNRDVMLSYGINPLPYPVLFLWRHQFVFLQVLLDVSVRMRVVGVSPRVPCTFWQNAASVAFPLANGQVDCLVCGGLLYHHFHRPHNSALSFAATSLSTEVPNHFLLES